MTEELNLALQNYALEMARRVAQARSHLEVALTFLTTHAIAATPGDRMELARVAFERALKALDGVCED